MVVPGAGLVPGEKRRQGPRRLGEVDDADDEERDAGEDRRGDEKPVVSHGATLVAPPVVFLTTT
jgi:hypothetical protein